MKAYGIPRNKELVNPDNDTINHYGLASHVGRIFSKNGDYHSHMHSAAAKKRTRRYWKKTERLAVKKDIRTYLS